MAENTAFSSSGEDVINRTITIEEGHDLLQEEFEDYYDIDRTVEEIVKGGYKRVCLFYLYCTFLRVRTIDRSSIPG